MTSTASETRRAVETETPDRTLPLGLLLIALFLVPDTISTAPLFPIQSVAVLQGVDLIALIVPAATGALMVALRFLLPRPKRATAVAVVAGLGALLVTWPENNHLSIGGPLATALTAATIGAGLSAQKLKPGGLLPELTVGILPAAALTAMVIAAATGALSPAYLVAFKTPAVVYLLLRAAVFSRP